MDLKRLLNPISCEDDRDYQKSKQPPPDASPAALISAHRRHKIAKDAPIFAEGNRTVGHVNFRPHEAGDNSELCAYHRQYSVYPLGEIEKKGVRHIPYNSDKKDFLEKTGRDAFEVFQYTYKRPGEDKEYTVVWDYNVGLVRMTPFFKSCKFTKTIPAKALRENLGLKEISYSITGGALVCQGYWMPYHAARAVAATFCWDIRWALTPVFGNDFPDKCRRPEHPTYANFRIDPETVQFCAAETEKFKVEGSSYRVIPEFTAPALPSCETINTQLDSPPLTLRELRRPNTRASALRITFDESGYGTDTEKSDAYLMSPEISPHTCSVSRPVSRRSQPVPNFSRFTSVNRACSPPYSPAAMCFPDTASAVTKTAVALSHAVDSPYFNAEVQDQCLRTKRTHSKIALTDEAGEGATANDVQSGTGIVRYDSGQESEECAEDPRPTGSDIAAAETLLCLSGGVELPPVKKTRHGSRH